MFVNEQGQMWEETTKNDHLQVLSWDSLIGTKEYHENFHQDTCVQLRFEAGSSQV